jgi:serine/threonine protein kinase, bacterial
MKTSMGSEYRSEYSGVSAVPDEVPVRGDESAAPTVRVPGSAVWIDECKGVYAELQRQPGIEWNAHRRFIKRLGTGGQGSVHLAERCGAAGFRVPVALKFFSPSPFDSVEKYDTEMHRLARVSAFVARIQDDHLIAVDTFLEERGVYFTEMEWIDGFDLLHILRRDTLDVMQESVTERRWASLNERVITAGEVDCRLKPGMAVAIVRECLAGISALHRGGIVHCDLKPSNVMVRRTGQVKIIDIGSAFWVGEPPEGQPCTLEYAAPEILAGCRATPQSDLCSLGYMLLEMLSGARPFAGLRFKELVEAKRTFLDRLPRLLPPEEFQFSESLIRLLRRMVAPDPQLRFPTAEDAELSDEGAAGFLRELVKSDMSNEYASELRRWILELEANTTSDSDPSSLHLIPDGTTRILSDSERRHQDDLSDNMIPDLADSDCSPPQ